MKAQIRAVEEYLSRVPPAKRAALEHLRGQIRAAAPEAEECLGYGMPAFRLKRLLVGYDAKPNHLAFYLMSATVLDAFVAELAGFDTGKGTIRFQPDEPLPDDLVRRLVAARVAETKATGREEPGSTQPRTAKERT